VVAANELAIAWTRLRRLSNQLTAVLGATHDSLVIARVCAFSRVCGLGYACVVRLQLMCALWLASRTHEEQRAEEGKALANADQSKRDKENPDRGSSRAQRKAHAADE